MHRFPPKAGGFPHSEIFGSKVTRHLPEAYRRHAASFIALKSQGIHRVLFIFPIRKSKNRIHPLTRVASESSIHIRNCEYEYCLIVCWRIRANTTCFDFILNCQGTCAVRNKKPLQERQGGAEKLQLPFPLFLVVRFVFHRHKD